MQRAAWIVAVVATALLATACSGARDTAGSGDDGTAVTVLARADGWRDGLPFDGFLLVEIATDEAAASRAWDDNVPDTLEPADGDPIEPGLYGALDDVDLSRQALVVVSSGGSSSCPPWVRHLDAVAGRVEVSLARDDATACTDDFQPYRLVLAVDRDQLPADDELPIEHIDVPTDNLTNVEGRVVAYPAPEPGSSALGSVRQNRAPPAAPSSTQAFPPWAST